MGDSVIYEYDGFNRLTDVSEGINKTEYEYNTSGLRTSKTVNGEKTDFILDGIYVIAEIKDGDVTNYIRGLCGIIYSKDKKGTKTYYVTNNHGDVTALVNSSGTIVKEYTYDEYGVEVSPDENDTNPFRYCGEYYDTETGFIYLRARYYDPELGRFISEDPARDEINWYVYCANNPTLYRDKTGLFRIADGESYDKYAIGSGNSENKTIDYISKDIKKMQLKLQELGYLNKSINKYGYFGEKTLAAVNAFKKDYGIQNDTEQTKGIVGATTWAMLGLEFDVIETAGNTISKVTMSKGVLHVDRNISNANYNSLYHTAVALKDAYKIAFGEDFNVTTKSVYLEIAGHLFADKVAEKYKNSIFSPFVKRIQRSTAVIDIGDNEIVSDNNRWLWDALAR